MRNDLWDRLAAPHRRQFLRSIGATALGVAPAAGCRSWHKHSLATSSAAASAYCCG